MSFFSTRGGACVTTSQSILWGLAKDGGLYVPSMFPQLSPERLAALCGTSYQNQASRILRDFLEDYSIAEIEEVQKVAKYSGEFKKDQKGSDALHWANGQLFVTDNEIVFKG
ncbi:MAG: hypothetical protein RR821_02585, partial [Clostridia bacterium]